MSDKKLKYESEMDFNSVIKNPIRMFGAVYFYFLLVGLSLGIYFVWNMDSVSFNKIQGSYIDSTIVVKDIPLKAGGLKPAVDLSTIQNSTPELVAKGKELFDANCMSCHGSEGKGDGPAGGTLNPLPRNFHVTEGWTNGRKFSDIYKTLQEGIIKNGMSPYDYLPPSDRIAIIHYIRTFTDFPAVDNDEVAALDAKYQLSKGIMEPNTIPLEMALNKIRNENKSLAEKIKLSNLDSDGGKLLKQYSINANEAVLIFITNNEMNKSLNDFIASVSANPKASGFVSSIVSLNESEWNLIFNYLKNYKA